MSDKVTVLIIVGLALFALGSGVVLGWYLKPEPKLIDTTGKIVIRQDSSALISMRRDYDRINKELHNLSIDYGAKDAVLRGVLSHNKELRKSIDSMLALGESPEFLGLDTTQTIHATASIPVGDGKDSTVALEIPVRTQVVYLPPPFSFLSLETSIGDFTIPYVNREYRSSVNTPSDTYGLWGITGATIQSYNPGISLGLGITDWYAKGAFSSKEPLWEIGRTWRIIW